MKKIIAGVAAVLIAVGVAPSAMAQTSIMTGSSPLTNLNPLGATLHLGLSNFPDGKGIYIFEVVKNPTGARPTIINNDQSSQAWVIANGPAGSTSPMGDIKVVVTATFGGQTCTDNCGLYFEYDHTNSTDTSEDHFVPISFSAAAPTSAGSETTTASVTVSGQIDGVALSPSQPGTLAYQTPKYVVATASDGSTPTLKITADPSGKTFCTLNGNYIKAVSGTGACNLEIQAGAVVGYFPFMLSKGVQTAKQTVTSIKVGKPKNVALKTSFGEKIAYKSATPKICAAVDNTIIGLKVGSCVLNASAVGTANYDQFSAKVTLAVVKK